MSAAVAAKVTGSALSFHRPDGQKRRVLYAEDQVSARVVTTALLERMGFEVEAVEDGELAFEKAKLEAFDVILLDIEMPIMDGVTAARHIRASAVPCRNTPILALSAFLADSTEHSIWRDAFDSALPKPANSNELQRAMHRVLSGKRDAQVPKVTSQAHWSLLARSLPSGTLSMLIKAAEREMQHLILAYGSCLESGDCETAQHCRKALKAIASSFEAQALLDLLQQHDVADTWPKSDALLLEAGRWRVH
jgi:CheY-like chemotaxis protein